MSEGTAAASTGSLFDLSGRVAIVTGAGSGLGRAIAIGLARQGADIAALDVDTGGAAATVEQVVGIGRRALPITCDVSDAVAVDASFNACDEALGPVDILVNNAFCPVVRRRPEEYLLEDWERAIAVNLTGYFLCARAAGKRMIKHGRGAIVNVSSIAGSSALGRGNLAYSVTKHGVNGLTRELAIEWAPHCIRVNAIQPSQFMTPAVERWLEAAPDREALFGRLLAGIPLGRIGDPEHDVIGPVVFLASDAAAMVTGVLLPVDGGNLALNAGGSTRW